MREEALKQFFVGDLSANRLAIEAMASINKVGPIETKIEIEDMSSDYVTCRDDVLLLCDAGLRGELPGDAITAIAFMLLASDRFEWNDDVISEVLNDWSCPEINYHINSTTLQMHRRWLLGLGTPPERPTIADNSKKGRLISKRRKVHVKGGP